MSFLFSARRVLLPVALLAAVFLSSRVAEAKALTVEVAAGDHDRANTPIRVQLALSADEADATDAKLTSDNGPTLTGQLTAPSLLAKPAETKPGQVARELNFVLPKLAAGQTAKFQVELVKEASDAKQFHWHDEPGKYAELSFGDRPVLRYMCEPLDTSSPERIQETFKVYHHVYDPAGKRYVTKGPGGLFPHHRGLFYGFNRISYGDKQQADIWHCRNGEHQAHRDYQAIEAGPVLGRHRLAIDWIGRDGKPFAVEQREMTAYNTPEGTLIEFASHLESRAGAVRLDGDPQHAGFQFRASQDVPDKTKALTYYLRPDGKGKPGSFRNWPGDKSHANLPWNALSFVLDDQRYTCCYLDRPQNPKESRFSERDYGRFGSYFEFDLSEDRPLDLNYRIWLQPGEMDVAGVSALSHDFVTPATATVE
ncbi:MAG: PmoA family protein [Planctomycetales bacterium]|nr:PmoA family protein [Planctomycetales bacterium]